MKGLIFDLDGTLVDSVYAHVLVWQVAFAEAGISIHGWRLHGRMRMSGGYGEEELIRAGAFRVFRDAADLHGYLDELGVLP